MSLGGGVPQRKAGGPAGRGTLRWDRSCWCAGAGPVGAAFVGFRHWAKRRPAPGSSLGMQMGLVFHEGGWRRLSEAGRVGGASTHSRGLHPGLGGRGGGVLCQDHSFGLLLSPGWSPRVQGAIPRPELFGPESRGSGPPACGPALRHQKARGLVARTGTGGGHRPERAGKGQETAVPAVDVGKRAGPSGFKLQRVEWRPRRAGP